MKENPYLAYNYQVLKALKSGLESDSRDPELTPKAQANAKIKLAQVKAAMRMK